MTIFALAMVVVHGLQFFSMLDAYVYARRNRYGQTRNPWQLMAMAVDLVIVLWGVSLLVRNV